MALAYLLLGSNMGQSKALLANAADHIQQLIGPIQVQSSIYKSDAWGKEDQDPFLNQVLLVETPLSASDLLQSLLKIEQQMGRIRSVKWGARIIDIDIVYFNNEIINEASLIVPHPKITDRRFVLLPIEEIAPDYLHPILLKSNTILLKECGDSLAVHKKTP